MQGPKRSLRNDLVAKKESNETVVYCLETLLQRIIFCEVQVLKKS